jgi:hypothetical protein
VFAIVTHRNLYLNVVLPGAHAYAAACVASPAAIILRGYSVVTVVSQSYHSGVTVVLQWCCIVAVMIQ